MGVTPLIRQVVLGVTTLFSLIVLASSAHLISQTQQYFGVTLTFCAVAVAVAVMSLLTLPVMFVVDILRHGGFTSMIVVELAWLSILWILWVATAGEAAYEYNLISPAGCIFGNTISNGMCQEAQVIEAFSFLNFIIVLLYTGFLSVMTAIAASRGQSVWMSSVKESFGSAAGPVEHPMTEYNASMPPQPQYGAGVTQPGATVGGPVIRV